MSTFQVPRLFKKECQKRAIEHGIFYMFISKKVVQTQKQYHDLVDILWKQNIRSPDLIGLFGPVEAAEDPRRDCSMLNSESRGNGPNA